jgi:hypothetical protein
MKTLLEAIEPSLAYAAELLGRATAGSDPLSGHIHRVERAFTAVRGARVYLELQRTPAHVMYDPRRVLMAVLEAPDDRRLVELEAVGECPGDPEQVRLCTALILDNVELQADAVLAVELFEEEEVPQIAVELDGPGRFADPLTVAGSLSIPRADLETRWTAVTRGGRIDRTVNGLRLRLKGVRVLPASQPDLAEMLALLSSAETALSQALKLVRRGAGGDESEGRAALAGAREKVQTTLARIDAGLPVPDPGNVCALIEDAVSEVEQDLKQRGLAVETWCDRNVPPIAMVRGRMRALVSNALRYAANELPSGGAVNVLVDYDHSERVAGLVFALAGAKQTPQENDLIASMRRAAQMHGAAFTFEPSPGNAAITVALPDLVGRRLDEWIPQWETFGDRSRQVLRLLKSGGPTPPAELLLEGVLEEELERWLLPRLETPAVVNIAHELQSTPSDLPGASAERLEKVLDQIRRRKPRKEAVRPTYAAELLWAYRGDARRRNAIGLGDMPEDDLRRLCGALLRKPSDFEVALELLARAAVRHPE